MYLGYSAILKNNTLTWLDEMPQDNDVEVIVMVVPKQSKQAVSNEWNFVKHLTSFDPTMEQAIQELKKEF